MAEKTTVKNWIMIALAVLTLLFFAVSFWVDDYRDIDVKAKDVERIEKKLHEQQIEALSFVGEHLSHATENGVFDSCWTQSLHDKDIALFILKNDSVVFWSDNLPVDEGQLRRIDSIEQYINVGNGWYVGQAIRHQNYRAVIFILIRTEYIYQNKFLQNSFNPVFGFTDNMMISPAGIDEGALVSGASGVPLFVITADVSVDNVRQSTLYRWLAVLAALLLFAFTFYDWGKWNKGLLPLFYALLILVSIRLLIFYNIPYFLAGIQIFSPTIYAASGVLRSLGDLLLHLIFVYLFVLILYRNWDELKRHIDKLPGVALQVARLVSLFIVGFSALGVNYIADSLILNSNISFEAYRISSLSFYSLAAFFALLLLFVILVLLIHLQTLLFADKGKKVLFAGQAVIYAILFISIVNNKCIEEYVFASIFLLLTAISVYKLSKVKSHFKYFTITVVLLSLFATVMMIDRTNQREQQQRELLANNLSAERDPAAEMLLHESEDKIVNDVYLRQVLNPRLKSPRMFYDRLIDYHFKGYFQNYESQFQICFPGDLLYLRDEDKYVNCQEFFKKEREQYGVPIQGSTHFWFMNNASGRVCYYGEFEFVDAVTGENAFLFINLFSKPESESIGYPELLLDSKIKQGNSLKDRYSYAKYKDGELVTQSGLYDYSLSLSLQMSRKSSDSYFVTINNYMHYVYNVGNGNVIVISRPATRYIDIASLFSYTIVLLFIGLFLLLLPTGYPLNRQLSKISYRLKITYVLLGSITISLTALTITVLFFIVRQSDEKNAASIQDKLRSVMVELEQSGVEIKKSLQENRPLTYVLINLSNAFYTDINLYNRQGELIASSRDEIFEKKLMGTRMNREAYKVMSMDVASKYIHWEQIGGMRYYSAYAPYYDAEHNLLAYINMPYFFKQSEFREEIMQLIANIVNIYILLILLGAVLALFISNQLLRPLSVVQQKMGRLDLTKQPEPINYSGNDEIGDLVREYNRMIGELAINAKKLAETERESAWREMARQIAHEIKNPLTPMRLSIQHVLRMKERDMPGWQDKLEAVSKSLLEQIDVLSNIASEFSSFARINEREHEPIDLSLALHRSINLFRVYDNVKFDIHEDRGGEKLIMGNYDQLQRVFTNLIKNAVQATENRDDGLITIDVKESEEHYIVSVEDNGSGIAPELQNRLFQPNFTTKSGGTGLGLAISRSIVESFGGSISFQPSESGGACFIVSLPKSDIGQKLLQNL